MVFDIGIYRLDINVGRTKMFYDSDCDIGCGCAGCRNFEKAVSRLPADVREFFLQFGIDPRKPAEISVLYAPDAGQVLYNGFYHLCGTILEGTNPWVKVSDKHFQLDERYAVNFSRDFSLFFTPDCHLLEPDFPRPAIQLEFTGNLPWLLEEPNPYT